MTPVIKPLMGSVGQVGEVANYGDHKAMVIHGRVYLNGNHMSEMTYEEACSIARYRASTQPDEPIAVDTGRLTGALAGCAIALVVLAISVVFK
ncbi:MAG: hypothetical protein A3E01_00090 [Gammaproteobacteria bacterium RIFCSPHIGHO2_12_FULL_63_22]|nr:MAG: hypothetical protein A3E01_00090 [Gammaproteobacteria bacterium RIFCSPHIGHO2_12_FULL_63_22]